MPPSDVPVGNSTQLWKNNVSWETKEGLFQMSDIIDQSDLLGLRPVYRKDLPQKYIAYWEVKLSEANKEKYMIISAGIFYKTGSKVPMSKQSRAKQSRAKQSRAEQNSRAKQQSKTAEQSRAEQNRAEQSRIEQSRAE